MTKPDRRTRSGGEDQASAATSGPVAQEEQQSDRETPPQAATPAQPPGPQLERMIATRRFIHEGRLLVDGSAFTTTPENALDLIALKHAVRDAGAMGRAARRLGSETE